MSPSQVPAVENRLQREGLDEKGILEATDVQMSLLFRNSTFAARLVACLSKRRPVPTLLDKLLFSACRFVSVHVHARVYVSVCLCV